ncbi:MAG: ATP-binding protein [Coriobacteriales bacterium]|nr:ATP-binding protein [Coriobacteriales bacterium]
MSEERQAQTQDLLGFVTALSGGDGLRVEERLGDGFVRLRVAEAERRQAKHDIRCVEDAAIELLRNARDAGATSIYLASSREGDCRTLTIVDNGSGIPPHLTSRIFDARVTSKLDTMLMDKWGVHGRGMALFSIRENAQEARVVLSRVGMGSVIQVRFDVGTIKERADQSTWPTLAAGGQGDTVVRGPRNIVRACVEFALESKDACNVYCGLPSEILATMRKHAVESYGTNVLEGREDDDAVPIVAMPACAKDARELAAVASQMGMEMSDRTAHRIIRYEIAPLRNVLAQVRPRDAAKGHRHQVPSQRTLPLSEEDRELLVRACTAAFNRVASRYYVVPVAEPSVRCVDGRLVVSIPYAEDE